MSFDIVIPVGPNDYSVIIETIEYTKKNVINYRNIYIVSTLLIEIAGCIYVNENIFPFKFNDIIGKVQYQERVGWYLQQLIKLTAGDYINGILDNYLVIDSDVYILKQTEFMREGVPLYAYGDENHRPYFDHMARLHPMLKNQRNISGICHHMMFNRNYLNELFLLVKENKNKSFIDAFIDEITEKSPSSSGASEYEIYFNYMLAYHPKNIIIRQLNWKNISSKSEINNCDYVAYHHYRRVD